MLHLDIIRVFVPGNPFQSSLMFVGKDWSTWYALHSGLLRQTIQQTRLERLTRDRHSSLLRKIVNYGQKSFIRLDKVVCFDSS